MPDAKQQERIMRVCAPFLTMADQMVVAEGIGLTPSQSRQLRLNSRDFAFRWLAAQCYSDPRLTKRQQALAIYEDLRAFSAAFEEEPQVFFAPFVQQTRSGLLRRVADLGGKLVEAEQIRKILAGDRTRVGA